MTDAIGNIGSALIGAKASKSAAKVQAAAAAEQTRLQKEIYDQTYKDLSPYRGAGPSALERMQLLLGLPSSSVNGSPAISNAMVQGSATPVTSFTPYDGALKPEDQKLVETYRPDLLAALPRDGRFTEARRRGDIDSFLSSYYSTQQPQQQQVQAAAPAADPNALGSALDVIRNTPGYQFRLNEGLNTVQNSAAARGGLGSGNSLRAVQGYAEGMASNEYQNYLQNLQYLTNMGQNSSVQTASAGQNYADNAGTAAMNAANAQANGYANQAAAWGSGLQSAAQGINGLLSKSGVTGGYDPSTGVTWNSGSSNNSIGNLLSGMFK
jgi:hypothetical protein